MIYIQHGKVLPLTKRNLPDFEFLVEGKQFENSRYASLSTKFLSKCQEAEKDIVRKNLLHSTSFTVTTSSSCLLWQGISLFSFDPRDS